MVVDGPTDADVFQAYVEQVRVPSLRPGDLVILDNLSPHKTAAVDAAIREAGAEVIRLARAASTGPSMLSFGSR